mmetsp:Transcript_1860/g.2641  ORF Transcript_1860/g.2641 Transcript_1860/m.2641 type:complete len:194 (+) Transcript_1860:78-659(+)
MFIRRPAATATQKTKQLNEFKVNFPNAKEQVNGEKLTYEIPMRTSVGTFSMIMFIPPSFPSTPPIITSKSPIRHRLFDSNMKLFGLREIQEWNSHSSLTGLVSSLQNHLYRTPPSSFSSPRPTRAAIPNGVHYQPTPQSSFPSNVQYTRPVQAHYNPLPDQNQYATIPTAGVSAAYQPPKADLRFLILDGYKY